MSIRVTGRSTKKCCDISLTELELTCYSLLVTCYTCYRASAKLDLTQWIVWTNLQRLDWMTDWHLRIKVKGPMHITGYVTEETDELKIENIGHKHRNSPRMPMNYYQQYILNCSRTTLASIDQNISPESILNCPIWTEFIYEKQTLSTRVWEVSRPRTWWLKCRKCNSSTSRTKLADY